MKFKNLIFFAVLIASAMLNACSEKNKSDDEAYYLIRKKLTLIDKMGPAFMEQIGKDIYKAVEEGKLTAYSNDTLSNTSKLTKDQAKSRGSYEEVIQYYPDPDYPDFYIDSFIKTSFTVDKIKGFEISVKTARSIDGLTSELYLNAFALRYEPVIGSIKLPEQALFWIKYEELKTMMKADDFKIFSNLVIESLSRQASDY